MIEGVAIQLGKPWMANGHLEFPVINGGEMTAPLQAYVRGVLIGSVGAAGQAVALEEIIRLSVTRFPHVDMPCEIRFSWGEGGDAAPALTISSPDDVLLLMGPGAWTDGELTISQGMIRGSSNNRRNGCARADFVCRVQAGRMRPVKIDSLTPLEEGGVRAMFSVQVELGDISQNGVVYEVLDLDGLAPVARLVLAPLNAASADAGILAAKAVEDIERRVEAALILNQKRTDSVLGRQERLLEQAVAYLSALIFDRLADPREPGKADGPAELMTRLLEGAVTEDDADYAIIEPGSPMLGGGWLASELNARRTAVSWMGSGASLLNPRPESFARRVVLSVDSAVDGVIGGLRAYWDGEEAQVVAATNELTPGSVVILAPGGSARLRTLSVVTGSGAHTGRSLSISEARIVYED